MHPMSCTTAMLCNRTDLEFTTHGLIPTQRRCSRLELLELAITKIGSNVRFICSKF